MVKHLIVDGSNIATEGRSKPSLKQLNEAVLAFMAEHPKVVITVIVDATFGHRIDPKEVPAFNKAVEHNELVTPPAGTVGRGDAFVLSIAEKADASILSNDSYQEFHGRYKWLFEEGRLIGGKPVPNVGWVFVERLPVRGEKSRMSERKSREGATEPTRSRSGRKVSAAAMAPMPVPKSPPPGGTLPARGTRVQKKTESTRSVNEIIPFLHFVEGHSVGSVVEGVVDSYSSHGLYVQIGDIRGYVPLRLLGDPPPRSAREAMKLGETAKLEVVEIIAARRSVNLKPTNKKMKVRQSTSSSSIATPNDETIAQPIRAKKPVKKLPVKKQPVKKQPVKKLPVKKRTTGVKKVSAPSSARKSTTAKKSSPMKPSAKGVVTKKSTIRKGAPRT